MKNIIIASIIALCAFTIGYLVKPNNTNTYEHDAYVHYYHVVENLLDYTYNNSAEFTDIIMETDTYCEYLEAQEKIRELNYIKF